MYFLHKFSLFYIILTISTIFSTFSIKNSTIFKNTLVTLGLKRSLSDFQSNGSRPPLPPKNTKGLGRTASGEIANKINKFEQLAKQGSPPREDIQKGLWFYKDGLRSPSTPPPRSRSNSLSPSPGKILLSNSMTISWNCLPSVHSVDFL